VMPLCLLAYEHPEIMADLEQQLNQPQPNDLMAQFALRLQQPITTMADEDASLLDDLAGAPRALSVLAEKQRYSTLMLRQVERLESRQLVLRAGFTPTDALHVLGRFAYWNADASRLGAAILARQTHLEVKELCERVVAGVSDRVTQALVNKVLNDEAIVSNWQDERIASALLARALDNVNDSDLNCRLTLNKPIVAIGAPVGAYLPRTASQLSTELVIPEHADVANAVGAVAGSVVQRLQAFVQPLSNGRLRLHLPEAVADFSSVAESVAYAEQIMLPEVAALAHKAGADEVEVHMVREDHRVPVKGGWSEQIYLSTDLVFTAVGRPTLARRN
jgi:N-methylhydantoinase A/oxoprolinase/acetone carboxylase beta subunit